LSVCGAYQLPGDAKLLGYLLHDEGAAGSSSGGRRRGGYRRRGVRLPCYAWGGDLVEAPLRVLCIPQRYLRTLHKRNCPPLLLPRGNVRFDTQCLATPTGVPLGLRTKTRGAGVGHSTPGHDSTHCPAFTQQMRVYKCWVCPTMILYSITALHYTTRAYSRERLPSADS
jgi:hypothetical protein